MSEEKKISNGVNILGVNISALSNGQTLDKIKEFLVDGKQHQIVTPNAEFLVEASRNEEFFYILYKADLAVPDGSGPALAALLMGEKIHRYPGADLIYDICVLAEKEKKSIYLLGGREEAVKKTAANLLLKYPDLKIAGAEEGLKHKQWEMKTEAWLRGEEENNKLIGRINIARPDIIFVAFGHPKQDIWIYHNLKKIPSVKIAMGVGGSFDFISGIVKRAPKILRSWGLEWLWRLVLEPWRWKRIFTAVIIFPLKFFRWRFIVPFQYRPNVACILYKKEDGKYKILAVKRSDELNHWQLPQGGTDGENLTQAGAREIKEETGTEKFAVKKTIADVYKYRFGERTGEYKKTYKFLGYRGQKQGLCIAEFTGRDEDIKINFWDHSEWKWVDSDKLVQEVYAVRQEATQKFLDKFNDYIDNSAKNK